MRTLHIQCSAGIAGDMFVGACLDAGLVTPGELQSIPSMLGLTDVWVDVATVFRASIAAQKVTVRYAEGGSQVETAPPRGHGHTHYDRLDSRLAASPLRDGAKAFARKVFRFLAEAESQAHGKPLDRVVFHEVGSVDSLVDVAMAGVCIDRIAPDLVTSSPVPLGHGFVDIVHGRLPIPPPASAYLARGLQVAPSPSGIDRESMELATPTGLAILRALQPRFVQGWPHGTLSATGIGAGSIELGRFANVLRVALIAEAESSEALLFETDQVFEVACNLDDQSPEKTAWVMEKAMERGALDCWVIPLVGKKGRPAVQLSMLVRPDDRDRFLSWILRVTTTFGVRFRAWDRWKLLKDIEEREAADGLPYRVSVGRTKDGTALKEKAEYEDVKRYWGTESSGQSE